jgi:hypothetical protein
MTFLLGALVTNQTLAVLNLDGNKIDDEGRDLIKHFENTQNKSLKLSYANQDPENKGNQGEPCVIC